MEYSKAFNLYRTLLSYNVEPLKESAETLKPHISTPSHIFVIIKHTLRRGVHVAVGDDVIHTAEEHEIVKKLKSIAFDSSLFASNDVGEELVHHCVHRKLSSAGINESLWEAISDAVMVEGATLVRANFEACNGYNSNSSPGSVNDTIVVDVVTDQRFVCYEDVGES